MLAAGRREGGGGGREEQGGCEERTYLQDQYLPKILLREPAPAASLYTVEKLPKLNGLMRIFFINPHPLTHTPSQHELGKLIKLSRHFFFFFLLMHLFIYFLSSDCSLKQIQLIMNILKAHGAG